MEVFLVIAIYMAYRMASEARNEEARRMTNFERVRKGSSSNFEN